MQKGFIAPIVILGVIIATIVAVGVIKLFSILPGNVSEKEAKSVINEFANVFSNAKLPTRTSLVEEPPWEVIKLVEKFANGKIGKDAKIDFRLTQNGVEDYHQSDTASFYISGTPFRWRADFDSKTKYPGIVANNNGEYYSCHPPVGDGSYNDSCGKVDSLENLSIPLPFTQFLGTALDTFRLKLFLTQIPQASIRTIAGKESDCLKVSAGTKSGHDLYDSELEICTDKENRLPLYIKAQNNVQQFILEAIKIEVSPLSADVFIPSEQSLKQLEISPKTAQPSPTSSDRTANWKIYTNSTGKYLLLYPPTLIAKEFTKTKDPNSPEDIPPSLVLSPNHNDNELSESIGVSVYKNQNNYSLKDWVTNEVWQGTKNIKYTSLTIDGEPAIRTSEIPREFEEDQVFVEKNNKIYQIILLKASGNQWKVIGEDIFDQILSTFKFEDRDYDAVIRADIKQIQFALEVYFNDNKHYPSTLKELSPNYLISIPHNRYDNSEFTYRSLDTDYELFGKLHDGSKYSVTAPK